MRVYTNDPYIKKRAKLAQWVSWGGLAVLALGLLITLRASPGNFLRFSRDPQALVSDVARRKEAVGFLTFAQLQQLGANAGLVTPVKIDGVEPITNTIASGQYPLVENGDAAVVVVNRQNTWIGEPGLSKAQLASVLSTANRRWSDVNPAWLPGDIYRLSLPQDGNAAFSAILNQVMAPVNGADKAEQAMLATANPDYRKMVMISFLCLGLGFIAAQIGGYNQRRFNRAPRPDEQLAKSLKSFDDRYSLYSWMLPAAYVFLGPSGLYTFALREHGNVVTNDGNKWKHKGGRLGMLLAFSNEGIGNPTLDAQSDAQKMQKFIGEKLPDAAVEVQPLALFTNPNVQLDLKNPVIPVIKPDQLKNLLRQRSKDTKIDAATLQKLEALFAQPTH